MFVYFYNMKRNDEKKKKRNQILLFFDKKIFAFNFKFIYI